MGEIKLVRVYDKNFKGSGYRILVDRIWPRRISKVRAHLDAWAKDITPTTKIRKWFGHVPERFPQFKAMYVDELNHNLKIKAFKKLVDAKLKDGDVIFLFGAKDLKHNHVIILKDYLEHMFSK